MDHISVFFSLFLLQYPTSKLFSQRGNVSNALISAAKKSWTISTHTSVPILKHVLWSFRNRNVMFVFFYFICIKISEISCICVNPCLCKQQACVFVCIIDTRNWTELKNSSVFLSPTYYHITVIFARLNQLLKMNLKLKLSCFMLSTSPTISVSNHSQSGKASDNMI